MKSVLFGMLNVVLWVVGLLIGFGIVLSLSGCDEADQAINAFRGTPAATHYDLKNATTKPVADIVQKGEETTLKTGGQIATGNYVGAASTVMDYLGWLFASGTTAAAGGLAVKLRKHTRPYDPSKGDRRAARRAAPPAPPAPPTPPASPAALAVVGPFNPLAVDLAPKPAGVKGDEWASVSPVKLAA